MICRYSVDTRTLIVAPPGALSGVVKYTHGNFGNFLYPTSEEKLNTVVPLYMVLMLEHVNDPKRGVKTVVDSVILPIVQAK